MLVILQLRELVTADIRPKKMIISGFLGSNRGFSMPRLPPQFNGKPAVVELRQTKGTYERKLAQKKLEIAKIEAYSNVVRNSILPLGIIAAGM